IKKLHSLASKPATSENKVSCLKKNSPFLPFILRGRMQNIPAFEEFLSVPRKVVIIPHFKPDADALGSALGFARYLAKKGHATTVVTPSDYPEFLAWMPG